VNIPFLYNAELGKNRWWRYLITIAATWGVQLVIGFIIGLAVILIFFIENGVSGENFIENIFQDPFFILLLTLVGYVASFVTLYLCVRFIHHRRFLSLITVKLRINWKRVLKGASVWFAILGIFTIISLLIDPKSYQFTFNPSTFGILVIVSLITFPIQASFEEIFFRGYLMQAFGLLSKKPIIPLLATSIIFGIVHVSNGSNMTLSGFPVIEASIIGLMLGIITLGESSIETAAGIHIMNNLYVALVVSTQGSVLGNVPSVFTAPSEPYSSVLWTIIFVIIALIIIFWGKRDKLMDIFRLQNAENESL
jgi:membrane protease YdiL (CAAX protease family)